MSQVLRGRTTFMLAMILGLAGTSICYAEPDKNDIDNIVQRAMDEFSVPGMTVSVVYGDDVFYARGKGIVETGKPEKVDAATLFQIASLTKAFTTAALAVLVDDGKIDWDAPVIDYLPEFRMYDAWVTREFTVRDLLTHRSGLSPGAGDLLIIDGKSTPDDVVRAMRHLKPSSSFRSQFDYDNLLYIVAGQLIAEISGSSFPEFLEERVLQPLGMGNCSATLSRADKNAVKATPHLLIDGKLQTTLSLESDLTSPTGGVNCSANDMARWMLFLLNDGLNEEGKQIISKAQMQQLFNPISVTSSRSYLVEHAGSFLTAYALGWNVSTFYGQPLYAHSGGLWGMTSYIAILPEQNLAVFASNNLLSGAPLAVVNGIVDRFLTDSTDQTSKDWTAIIKEVVSQKSGEAEAIVNKAMAERDKNSTPSLALAAYTGTYRDPWYGDIRIVLKDGQLWFESQRSETFHGRLEHFQYNTFIARWEATHLNADAYVSFSLGAQGNVEGIKMKAVSPATDFSFDFHDLDLKRVP